jgi:NAD(P)-dependent dehydrogenase (short-subunit alcohol dehydrogenase family)
MSIEGKVAIVTGGASGIGRASAAQLAGLGARVVVADLNAENGERVVAAIRERGGAAAFRNVDLVSMPEIEALVAWTVERFGQIDILVNAAAIYPGRPFLEVTPELWDQILNLDLRSVYFLTQAVAQQMVPRRQGVIINIAAEAAHRPVKGLSAYTAAKGGLVAMTRTIAFELAEFGIRVNAVSPGHTTSETVLARISPEQLDAVAQRLSPGRWLDPEEIAETVVFLAGDDAAAMTGAVLAANAGSHMPH